MRLAYLFLSFFLFLHLCSSSQQVLSIASKSISFNKYSEIDINLQNSLKVSAIQFDINSSLNNIIFPSVSDSIINTNRFDGHSISYTKISETQLRVIIFSLSNKNFTGVNGNLLTLKIKSGLLAGVNNLILSNVIIADSLAQSLPFSVLNAAITVIAPQLSIPDTIRLGNIPLLTSTSNSIYLNNSGTDTLKILGISSSNTDLSFTGINLPISLPKYQGYNLNYNLIPSSKGNKVYSIKIVSNDPLGDKFIYIKDSAYAVNKLYFSNTITGSYNSEATVSISIKNQENFSAFQFSINLPDGIDYVNNSISLETSRKTDHVVNANITNGTLTIIAYSSSLTNFQLNDGQVLTFKIKLNKQGGTYSLPISNASITNANALNIISDYISGTLTIKSPIINLSTSTLNFGKISTKEYTQSSLSILNNGTENLVINNIQIPSNAISTNSNFPITIPPGGNQSVNFIFHSTSPIILNSTTITIQSNDPNGDKNVLINAISYTKNELYFKSPYLRHSTSIRVPIIINNYDSLRGLQFDIQLNGLNKVSFNDTMFLLSDRFKNFTASYQVLDNQNLRVIIFSQDAVTILPDSVFLGEVLLNILTNQADGNYGYIDFANVVLGNKKGENLYSGKLGQSLNLCNGSINLNMSGKVQFCNQIILQASTGNSVVWYKNDTLLSNANISKYTITSSGIWKSIINNGSCNYISNSVETEKFNSPAIPVIKLTGYNNFCNGDSVILSTTLQNNIQWALNGITIPGDTLQTKVIKNTGIYTLQNKNAAGCISVSSPEVITVNLIPSAPTVKDTVFCQNISSSTLLATGTSGNTITWYGANATGGTGNTSAVVASTTDTTTKSYYVSQISNTTSCESPRAKITVKINPTPASPSVKDTAYCNNISADTLKATSLTGHTLNWYGTSETGGTASILGSKPTTTTVGSFSYYVSQKNITTGCEGVRAKIGVIINPLPLAPIVSDTNYCNNASSDTLRFNTSTGATLLWYGTNATGGAGSSTAIKPSTSTVGTANYYLSQIITTTGCEGPRSKVVVTINALPTLPTVKDTVFCQNISSSTLLATGTSGNTITWYGTNATGGTGNTSAVIASTADTTTKSYYVSQINNTTSCESPRSKITVKINSAPTLPIVRDTAYCNNISADTLKATSLIGHTLNWFGSSATGGTASILGSKPATTTVGSFSYYVSQKNNTTGCEGARAKIGVTINPLPVAPIVSDTNYCNNASSDTLRFNTSTGATLLWYGTNATGGTGSSTAIKPSTATVGTANYYLSQIITATGCEGPRSKVVVTTKPIPSAPSLSRDTANFLLSGTSGTTWYKDGSAITDTTQKYKPSNAGSYSAKTTINGCTSVMSAAYYYLVTDIINLSKDEFIKLAPNPFINKLNFDFIVKGYQKLNIEVFDLATGSKVAAQQNITAGTQIQLSQLASGTYLIRVISNDNKIVQRFKIMKL